MPLDSEKGPAGGPFFVSGNSLAVRIMNITKLLQGFWRFCRQIAKRFDEDRCSRVAGALSFTTVLAIVPLTAVIFAVLSLFPVFETWMSVIQNFVYRNFVPASGDVVQMHLSQLAGKAGRLTAIGLVFLVITAILLMATIEEALNDIWRVTNTRKWVYRFLSYWALLTLGPLLIAASLALTSQFIALPFFGRVEITLIQKFLDVVLPLVLEIGAAMLLYTVVPNVAVRWRNAFAGALFAALLLEIAKALFATSMKTFSSYQIIYGAIAALPVFLIWIYISWVIILLGAVVAANLNEWFAPPVRKRKRTSVA